MRRRRGRGREPTSSLCLSVSKEPSCRAERDGLGNKRSRALLTLLLLVLLLLPLKGEIQVVTTPRPLMSLIPCLMGAHVAVPGALLGFISVGWSLSKHVACVAIAMKRPRHTGWSFLTPTDLTPTAAT